MAMKYGRRPPKNTPALRFGRFRSPTVPAHPATVDYLATLSSWQVLGNDIASDCNAVVWANMRRLVTATLTTEYYPNQEQVWRFYETQNPDFDPGGGENTNGPGSSADGGMDVQTGLEYLTKHGGPDGVKAVAFAKVDHTNADEVDAALAIFGSLWLGITVLDGNENQFDDNEEWTYIPGSRVAGGHAVIAGGYVPDVKFVTWGQETAFAESFWDGNVYGKPLVEEAWVVIWPEHFGSKQFLQSVDVAALAADYQQLTGRTLPLPIPTPTPTPVISVDAADRQLASYASIWVNTRHIFNNARMRSVLKTWLTAKGFD